MIIKLDLESDQYSEIEKLANEGKYQDVIQFIKIAISNQIQEEKSEDSSHNESRKPTDDSEHWTSIEDWLGEKVEKIQNNLSSLTVEKSDFQKDEEPFIWSFYNRFFPIKIVIHQLASLIKPNEPWVSLEDLQDNAVSIAQGWYKFLKEKEIENEFKSNQKLTIGLPTHPYELEKPGIKKREKNKLEKKIISSKSRYRDQFVGRHNIKNKKFDGACFRMGLISAKITGGKSFVSLTKLGKEFALLKNPIIENREITNAFSNEEVKLIYEKIIPQFKVEKQIIEDIISELKQKPMTSNEIQKIFEGYKKLIFEYYPIDEEKLKEDEVKKKKEEKITQTRVATMGRLSEVKIVKWTVISSISHYSLNEEKMSLLDI